MAIVVETETRIPKGCAKKLVKVVIIHLEHRPDTACDRQQDQYRYEGEFM